MGPVAVSRASPVAGGNGRESSKALGRQLWPVYGWAVMLCGGTSLLLLTPTLYVMQVFDRVLASRSVETLTALTAIACVGLLTYGGLEWARGRLMSRLGQWLEQRLGAELVMAGIEKQLAGSPIGAQGLRDLQIIKGFFSNRAVMAFFDAPWSFLFIGGLWMLHPWLGVFCIFNIGLLLLLAMGSELLTARLQSEANTKQISLQRWCDASLEQAEAITALGMREGVLKWYSSAATALHATADLATGRLESAVAISRTIRQIMQIAITGLAAWLAVEDALSAGGVIASSILLYRALAPFDQLIAGWRQLIGVRDARERLRSLLQEHEPEVRSELPNPRGALSFHRLTVRSPGGNNRWLLQDISFNVEPGQGLGVIGPSGAGKTTLCRVAAGVVPPDIGEARLDGARLGMWDSDRLGRRLGYLPQDIGLLPATVAENIARLDRFASPAHIHAAAHVAGAHEMILTLPSGYDTLLGPSGVPLSGGQRQRIGLARALFGDPVVLILDEPDAHLDAAGEEALRVAIMQAKERGASVILIAQRPSMIMLMDQILVLQNGKATKLGPRAEVLRTVLRKDQGAV
jgi:PrtD family type I secretion system ABC transporter